MKAGILAGLLVIAMTVSAPAAQLTVVNGSSRAIQQLYVSPSNSSAMDSDRLGEEVIGVDKRFTVHDLPDGTYDIKFVDEDKNQCTLWNVKIEREVTWTVNEALLKKCAR